MIPNYRTIAVSGAANENLVPKIYEKLKESGYSTSHFSLDFVGFEITPGITFKINGNPLKVPSTGIFFTPYSDSNNFLQINSLTFDIPVNNLDMWIIY